MQSPATSLPANLAAPCPPLPLLDDGQQKTLAAWIGEASYLYHDCAARHAATVKSCQGDGSKPQSRQ